MPSPAGDVPRGWALARWLTVVAVALIVAALVPPGTLPFAPGAAFSDAAISHWPSAYFLRDSVWEHGQWPLWNPLRMLGQPFAANPLNKVWYPPQWLVLVVPPTAHLSILLYLHMAWLVLGIFAWARHERLHVMSAVLASAAWGLSARLLGHLGAGHLDIVYALAWAPWLLWAGERLAGGPLPGRAVTLGVVAALLALADLRVALYLIPAIALYSTVRAVQGGIRLWVWARCTALAGVVFALLTAVQTIPLIALGPHLTRAAITPEEAAAFSLPPRYLIGAIFPDAGGFHEFMTYLSVPLVCLLPFSLAGRDRRPGAVTWLALATGALVWALGEHAFLFPAAARIAPLVSWLRVPSRAYLVVVLAAVVGGAWGLDHALIRRAGSLRQVAALALGVTGFVWLAASALVFRALPPTVVSAGAALAASGVGLWLAGMGSRRLPGRVEARHVGGAVIVGAAALSLALVGRTLVEGRPVAEVEAADRAILPALGSACDTVYSPSFDLIGPATARAGIPTLHGVDPFQLAWSAAAIAEAAGVQADGYSITSPPLPADAGAPALALRGVQPDADRLAALGVRWVVARFPLDSPGLSRSAEAGGATVYETAGSTPLFISPEQINAALQPDSRRVHNACDRPPNRLLSAAFDTLPVEEPAVLVLPQSWAPGWQARVDGQRVPVLRVAGALVGVEIPTLGSHTVEIVYRPAADLAGAGISGIAAVGLAAGAVIRTRRGANG
jgi:hypothetical protein